MRIFLSWSGEQSGQIAEVIRNWLPNALQFAKPYFTPTDIEKGARWDSEISKELEASNICIVALTRESLNSKWIVFEAGAISRTVDRSRVCAILFGIKPTDLTGPLERFQNIEFSKKDIQRLLITINNAAGEDALAPPVLHSVFSKWWPDLQNEVAKVLNSFNHEAKPTPLRTDRELLEETLTLVRSIASPHDLGLKFRKSPVIFYRQGSGTVEDTLETGWYLAMYFDTDKFTVDSIVSSVNAIVPTASISVRDTGFTEIRFATRSYEEGRDYASGL
ncbi:MAG: TIR domain-containing protein, partial [Hyphomicrobiaceae bacterium]